MRRLVDRKSRCPGRGNGGFTLVETVMAIVVFTVVGTAVTGASVVAVRALTAAHADMVFTSNLGLVDHHLRTSTALVRFPFWLKDIPELDDPEHLSLPYAGGEKTSHLDITFDESKLTVTVLTEADIEEEALGRRVFIGFASVTWEYLKNEKEEPVGLVFSLVPEAYPEKTITIQSRFSSVPLGELYE